MSRERCTDRARVYRALARMFQVPERSRVDSVRNEDLPAVKGALGRLGAEGDLLEKVDRLVALFSDADLEQLRRDYESTFEPSGGLRCSPNETSHAPNSPQEAMVRTFEMADIAGFYRAFGVEIAPGTERVDHVGAELEFMHLLAVKELLAEQSGDPEHAEICRDASLAFLRDHLIRWMPKLGQSLEEMAEGPVYRLAGEVAARFVELDWEGHDPA
ncbi:MAG: molecular chaperone TorD family protein [Myxococcota bacterium]